AALSRGRRRFGRLRNADDDGPLVALRVVVTEPLGKLCPGLEARGTLTVHPARGPVGRSGRFSGPVRRAPSCRGAVKVLRAVFVAGPLGGGGGPVHFSQPAPSVRQFFKGFVPSWAGRAGRADR